MRRGGGLGWGSLNDFKFGTFIGCFQSGGAANKHGSERVKAELRSCEEEEVDDLGSRL